MSLEKLKYKKKPINKPIINLLELVGKDNSEVKIYIPKIVNDKGIKVPSVKKGSQWYVYCYFRNPKTGRLDYKYKVYAGINRYKSVKERLKKAKLLKKAVEQLIKQGFTPFEKFERELANNEIDVIDVQTALDIAIKTKKKQWSENTIDTMLSHVNKFTAFLKQKDLLHTPINGLKKKQIASFFNNLNLSNKSINNYRATISSLFSQMVADDLIEYNIISTIPVLKVKPNKNKPYTKQQINEIRGYLKKNDPYLLQYLQFVTYAFLRPIEVNRLTIADIDLENLRIIVKTKTEKRSTILIINKLKTIIDNMEIHNANQTDFLFTKYKQPGKWVTKKEKQRQEWFMKRFRKVKKIFNLNDDYSIYSFRHTFAMNLYHKFLDDGLTDLEAKHKLMTITRHKSLSGLENYLRDIGTFVPKDYSNDYTIEF